MSGALAEEERERLRRALAEVEAGLREILEGSGHGCVEVRVRGGRIQVVRQRSLFIGELTGQAE